MKSLSSEDLLMEFKNITEELNEIYANAPRTTDKAVALARNAIKIGASVKACIAANINQGY